MEVTEEGTEAAAATVWLLVSHLYHFTRVSAVITLSCSSSSTSRPTASSSAAESLPLRCPCARTTSRDVHRAVSGLKAGVTGSLFIFLSKLKVTTENVLD